MDHLTCIDPNLLQLLEEDDDVPALPGPSESTGPQPILHVINANDLVFPTVADDNNSKAITLSFVQVDPGASSTEARGTKRKHEADVDHAVQGASGPTPDVVVGTDTLAESSKTILVTTFPEAEAKIQEHEREYGVLFRKHKFPKNFGNSDWRNVLKKKKVYIDGNLPFIKAANDACVYECRQGPDHDAARKQKRRANNTGATRNRVTKTKKVGCPVRVFLEERIYFPQFQVKETVTQKLETSLRATKLHLRNIFSSDEAATLPGERRIWMSFGLGHNHDTFREAKTDDPSPKKEKSIQTLDHKVVDRIHRYIWQGLEKTADVRHRLLRWIWFDWGRDLKLPQILGKAVPNQKDLFNHVNHAKQHRQTFMKEQSDFHSFVEGWQSRNWDDLIHFRPYFRKRKVVRAGKSGANEKPDQQFDQHTWERLKHLQSEGAVFLMDEDNTVLAFGKKMPGFDGTPPESELQWFEITEVMSPGLKTPHDNTVLEQGTFLLWPNNLVLDVVVETFESNEIKDAEEFSIKDVESDIQELMMQDGRCDSNLLFVYQSKFQSELLAQGFGNSVCFLDMVTHAFRSNLVFYILWVKTDRDFQAVALIVTEDDENKLSDALSLLQDQTPSWKPKYFLTTTNPVEVRAIESAFPQAEVFFASHYVTQAWDRWFANDTDLEDDLKLILRKSAEALARSRTMRLFEDNLSQFRKVLAECSNDSTTRHWESKWLSQCSRWVFVLSCVRVLDQSRSRVYLSLDSNTFLTETPTFHITKRLVSFANNVKGIVEHWMPQQKRRYEEAAAKPNESTKEAGTSLDVLKQILTVFEVNSDVDSLAVCKELFSSNISDLVPIMCELPSTSSSNL